MKHLTINEDSMHGCVVYVHTLYSDTELNIENQKIKVFTLSGYSAGKKISSKIPCFSGSKFYPKKLSFDTFSIPDEYNVTRIAFVDTSAISEGAVELKSKREAKCYTFKDNKEGGVNKALNITSKFKYHINEKMAVEALDFVGNQSLKGNFLERLIAPNSKKTVSLIMQQELENELEKLKETLTNINEIESSIREHLEKMDGDMFKDYMVVFSDFEVKVEADEAELNDILQSENESIRSTNKYGHKKNIMDNQAKLVQNQITHDEEKKNIEKENEIKREFKEKLFGIVEYFITPVGKQILTLIKNDPKFLDILIKNQSGGFLQSSILGIAENNVHKIAQYIQKPESEEILQLLKDEPKFLDDPLVVKILKNNQSDGISPSLHESDIAENHRAKITKAKITNI